MPRPWQQPSEWAGKSCGWVSPEGTIQRCHRVPIAAAGKKPQTTRQTAVPLPHPPSHPRPPKKRTETRKKTPNKHTTEKENKQTNK